jgi:serine/threonine-protein kinase RsbW
VVILILVIKNLKNLLIFYMQGENTMISSLIFEGSINTDILKTKNIINKIVNILETMNINDNNVFEIKVILNELINNAVIHGNKRNKEKKIYIKLGKCGNNVWLIVSDEGKGIDDQIPCKKHFESVDELCEHGRGLCIVKALCETFKINLYGNKIVVLKSLR